MTALNLKFSDKKRPSAIEKRSLSPKSVVLSGIDAQLALLKDPSHTITRERYVTVVEGGETRKIKKTVQTSPRLWFWVDETGTYFVQVKYGSSHVVELAPNLPSIEAGKSFPKDVEKVLLTVRKAVEEGLCDEAILAAKQKARRSIIGEG